MTDARLAKIREAAEETRYLIITEARELLAEIDRLRADGARLDYLQDGSCNVEAVMEMDPESDVGFIVRPYNDNPMPGATLRDAVDACMHGEYDAPNVPVRRAGGPTRAE